MKKCKKLMALSLALLMIMMFCVAPVSAAEPKADSYGVLYEFKSGTRGAKLPTPKNTPDMPQLPVDSETYQMGKTVYAIKPTKTEFIGLKNDNNPSSAIGKWTFKGYDAESKVVSDGTLEDGADPSDTKLYIIFTGTWVFEAMHNVVYEFKAEDETMTLPEDVTEQLPENEMVDNGGSVSVSQTAFKGVSDTVDGKNGMWLFTGWDKESVSNVKGDITFTGTWKFYETFAVDVVDLVAYEGGFGSNQSVTTGDALPEPTWTSQLEDHVITVDGNQWNVADEGLPFTWKYLDENNEEVTQSARKGTYSLYVYPLENLKDAEVIVDGKYLLWLPEEGISVGTVSVRDITDDAGADNLSPELFKNIYNYNSPLESAGKLSLFGRLLSRGIIEGTFNDYGTHDDDCDSTQPHAHVDAGTEFYKNGNTNLPVNDNAKVGMLWDELLSNVLGEEEQMNKLHAKSLNAQGVSDVLDVDGIVRNDFKYIDLVDMNDGNVWVGTESNPVTIYMPYTEDMTEDDDIAVTYFDGLTRDYTVNMDAADLDKEIEKSDAHYIEVRKTDSGILFDVPSKKFGPFEILYQKSFGVKYEFESADKNLTLPEKVEQLLPKDNGKYVEGSNVKAAGLTSTEVDVDGGKWSFEGWNKNEQAAGENVTFVGIWKFVKNSSGGSDDSNQPTAPGENNGSGDGNAAAADKDGAGVETGDMANILLWSMIMLVSVLAALCFSLSKRGKSR